MNKIVCIYKKIICFIKDHHILVLGATHDVENKVSIFECTCLRCKAGIKHMIYYQVLPLFMKTRATIEKDAKDIQDMTDIVIHDVNEKLPESKL